MAKKKNRITTPAGIAVYPRLKRPDFKYKDNGQYKADIRIPIEEAKELMKLVGDRYKSWMGTPHPKMAPMKDREALWAYETDDDGDFIKTHVIFKFRVTNVETKDGDIWDRRPKLFDARGKPIKEIPNVGGGTEMKVSFEIDEFTHKKGKGIRLVPVGVQILDLVEFEAGGKAEDYGFGEEEGFAAGYSDEDDDDNEGDNNDNNDAETEENQEDFY